MKIEARPPSVDRSAFRVRRERERRLLVYALVILDTLALVVAVVGADVIRLAIEQFVHVVPLAAERHLIASTMVPPALLVIFRLQGLYDLDNILAGTREYARIAQAVTYGVFVAVTVSYFVGGNPIISRLWLVLIWVLAVTVVGGERFAARRAVRWLRRRGHLRTRVMIVGASTHGMAIADQLARARNEGLDVVEAALAAVCESAVHSVPRHA